MFFDSRHLWSALSRTYKVVTKINKWASHLTRCRVPDGIRRIALFATAYNGPGGRCRLAAVGPRPPFASLRAWVEMTGRWCHRGTSPRRGLVTAPLEVCAAVADPVALLAVLLSRELELDPFLLFVWRVSILLRAIMPQRHAAPNEGGASILLRVGILGVVNISGPCALS